MDPWREDEGPLARDIQPAYGQPPASVYVGQKAPTRCSFVAIWRTKGSFQGFQIIFWATGQVRAANAPPDFSMFCRITATRVEGGLRDEG